MPAAEGLVCEVCRSPIGEGEEAFYVTKAASWPPRAESGSLLLAWHVVCLGLTEFKAGFQNQFPRYSC
ncbi:MAG: hypothetical protein HY685_05355 [Chloroflexi bacterium]|nr:hypothetical protein [Chloroflexota bacterium]